MLLRAALQSIRRAPVAMPQPVPSHETQPQLRLAPEQLIWRPELAQLRLPQPPRH